MCYESQLIELGALYSHVVRKDSLIFVVAVGQFFIDIVYVPQLTEERSAKNGGKKRLVKMDSGTRISRTSLQRYYTRIA